MIQQLNSPVLYLICGAIVLFVALVCVFFAIRAYRAGKAIGIDESKLKQTVVASVTFAILPSVGILLGVIALSGSLGIPWPWLRLSVIGALHYETQVAEAAAEAVGLDGLSASQMTAEAFSTIALLMSVCIMWGMVFCIFTCKGYTARLAAGSKGAASGSPGGSAGKEATQAEASVAQAEAAAAQAEASGAPTKKKGAFAGFGDKAMTAMFIGLVSAYIGSYLGGWISGGGKGIFAFGGSWLPLAVAACGAAAMAVFTLIKEKAKAEWVDSFSIAGSMLIAMTCAIFLGRLI